jgi:hypothetical protein
LPVNIFLSLLVLVASYVRKHQTVYAEGKETEKGPDMIEEAAISNKF